jgi:hypothetical protein
MLSSNEEIAGIVRKNVLMEYLTQVRCKVLVKKKQAIERMLERKD